MKMKKLLIALPLVYMLSSCVSIGNSEAPSSFLVLTASNSVSADQITTADAKNTIVVSVPDTPRKLATNRIPVQINDSSIAYIQNAFWADKPAKLMQQLISETLSANGHFVAENAQNSSKAKQIISGSLDEFGVVENGPYAIVRFDAVKSNGGSVIEKRRFEARQDISLIDANEAGAALNQAANQVAAQIADWVK